MNLRDDKRDLWNGFGDGLARAFEFAVTPAIFAGIGLALDRRLGVFPVLTIGLFVLAMVGMFVKLWFAYDAQMRAIEEQGSWRRQAAPRTNATPSTPVAATTAPGSAA